MNEISVLKDRLNDLVKVYESGKDTVFRHNEAQTRLSLIDPFWEALGWNIRNPDQVEVESALRHGELSLGSDEKEKGKRPDYRFLSKNRVAFVLEAKEPSKSLRNKQYINQVKRYGYSLGIDLGILMDFEEFRPFDTAFPVSSQPEMNLIKDFDIRYAEYPYYAEKLLSVFGREAVTGGSIEKLVGRQRQGRQVIPVDKIFLDELKTWRNQLAVKIAAHNLELSDIELNEVTGRLINRLIFIKTIEQRDVLLGKPLESAWLKYLKQIGQGARIRIYDTLLPLFREMDRLFNGVLFKDDTVDKIKMDDKTLEDILTALYNDNTPYDLAALPVEIIGTVYERFLGEVLIRDNYTVKVEEKPEVRKAGGVFYTPRYIVQFIVDETVGKLLEGKTPEQVAKLRILDPACGSGSFLIGVYEKLVEWHLEYYKNNPRR
jgi:adenine-specific DNA-methyltransferase